MNLNQTSHMMVSQAKRLLADTAAMTLSTGGSGGPWAAPVYYAAWGPGLYFFSSPDSRHITEALAAGQAACAIHTPDGSWKNLMGLQMTGVVQPVSGQRTAALIMGAYFLKFPFVKDFFSGNSLPTLSDLARRFRAGPYVFLPESVFFMDNSIGFGFRRPIDKKELFS